MARIETLISADNFEIIRDKIAAILLDELQNQFQLSGATDPERDQDLNFSKIWVSRRTPFNLSTLPAINVSISDFDNTNKTQRQRKKSVKYYIDVMHSKKHDQNGYADQLSDASVWKLIRNCEYILEHPVYSSLELSPYIFHTEVARASSGEAEIGDSGKCMIARLEFIVDTISSEKPLTPADIVGLDTKIKLHETNEGYFYKLDL